MSNDELIRNIKTHKKYKGQLLLYRDIQASKINEKYNLNTQFEYVLNAIGIRLFDFQEKAILAYQDDKDIFIAGGYGSGRSTTIDILSVYTLFFQGQSIIYLLPNTTQLEEKSERLRSSIQKIIETIPFTITFSDSSEHLIEKLKHYPEIVITTAEIFYNCIKKYSSDKVLRDFLFSLGLVGIEKIELYKPKEIIFITRLINLLDFFSNTRFAITSSSDEDFPSFSNILDIHRTLELISIKEFNNNNDIFFWIPPFKVELLADNNTFSYRRENYLEEVSNLINILEDLGEVQILIWFAYDRLTSSIRQHLSLKTNITIIDDLASFTQSGQKKFDDLMIIGMPRDFKDLEYNVNNFVKNNGGVFIIPPDDLLSYLLMWSHYKLIEKLPGRKLFPLSETDLLKDMFVRIRKDICGKRDKETFIPYWGSISKNFINVQYPSGRNRELDKDLLPFEVYQGKIYFENEKCFSTNLEESPKGTDIKFISPGEIYARSTPIIDFKFTDEIEIMGTEKETKYYKVTPIKAKLYLEQNGNILFTDYSQESRNAPEIFSNPYIFSKNVRGVRLETKFPKEFEHAMYNFLPLLFSNPFNLIFIINDSRYIYIFPHQDSLYHFVEKNFYLDFNSTAQKLFKFVYEAIKGCPCENGCSKCIYYAYHQDVKGLNKEQFGMYFARIYGNKEIQSYENLIKFRKGNIKDIKKLTNFYNDIKRKITEILKNNLDIRIQNPVPLKVVKKLDRAIGIYNSKNVRVIPLRQQHAIGVITHEYIHNWQDQVGILARKDKFLTEGSAQWLSTKVLNYYYRIDEIETDIMGTSAEETKEYFNGFQFLQEVEDNDGYLNILNSLIEASWTPQQKEIRKKWEEYKLP